MKLAVITYIIFISILSVAVCCLDKFRARHRGRRIPERTLLLLCLLGGSLAMYITMRIIHHKTRHNKFMILVPLMIILQVSIAVYIAYNGIEFGII